MTHSFFPCTGKTELMTLLVDPCINMMGSNENFGKNFASYDGE